MFHKFNHMALQEKLCLLNSVQISSNYFLLLIQIFRPFLHVPSKFAFYLPNGGQRSCDGYSRKN